MIPPALLRANLPTMIRALGRDFISPADRTMQEYFADLDFSLDELVAQHIERLRVMSEG